MEVLGLPVAWPAFSWCIASGSPWLLRRSILFLILFPVVSLLPYPGRGGGSGAAGSLAGVLRCFLWSAGRAARASRWSRARLERGQVLLCAARASCNNLPLLPSHPPRCRRRLGTSSLSAAAWRWPLARHDVKHDVRHVTGRIAPISGRSLPLGLIGRPVCLSVPCVRPSASMSRLLEAAGERPPQRCVVPHSCSLPFRFISQLCCISISLQLHCILRAIRAGAAVIIVQMAKQRNEGIIFSIAYSGRARASALLRRERGGGERSDGGRDGWDRIGCRRYTRAEGGKGGHCLARHGRAVGASRVSCNAPPRPRVGQRNAIACSQVGHACCLGRRSARPNATESLPE